MTIRSTKLLGFSMALGACLVVAGAQEPPANPEPSAPPIVVAPPPSATTTPATAAPGRPEAKHEPARRPNRAQPLGLAVISEKVARYPDNPYLLNEMGNLLLKEGRRLEAEERYMKAVELDDQFAAAWNNLGIVRSALGNRTEAETALRTAVEVQPNYALAWYNLGTVLDAEQHYEQAVKAYERAFVLDPGLLNVKKNPQVVSNKLIAWVAAQTYIDRGGSVYFPIESAYPDTK
jgi:tetratricopeptide (TPR) repeat protein